MTALALLATIPNVPNWQGLGAGALICAILAYVSWCFRTYWGAMCVVENSKKQLWRMAFAILSGLSMLSFFANAINLISSGVQNGPPQPMVAGVIGSLFAGFFWLTVFEFFE